MKTHERFNMWRWYHYLLVPIFPLLALGLIIGAIIKIIISVPVVLSADFLEVKAPSWAEDIWRL